MGAPPALAKSTVTLVSAAREGAAGIRVVASAVRRTATDETARRLVLVVGLGRVVSEFMVRLLEGEDRGS